MKATYFLNLSSWLFYLVQILNKLSQSFVQVWVDGKVLILVHVVYIIPLDVYGDPSLLSLIQDLFCPFQGLVAKLALLIAQGPVGW